MLEPWESEDNLRRIRVLDRIQHALEKEIYYSEITGENLYHEEIREVVRAFFFSTGDREQIIVIGANGYIHDHLRGGNKKQISKELFMDVLMVLMSSADIEYAEDLK